MLRPSNPDTGSYTFRGAVGVSSCSMAPGRDSSEVAVACVGDDCELMAPPEDCRLLVAVEAFPRAGPSRDRDGRVPRAMDEGADEVLEAADDSGPCELDAASRRTGSSTVLGLLRPVGGALDGGWLDSRMVYWNGVFGGR